MIKENPVFSCFAIVSSVARARHAFQAVLDLPREPIDCFAHTAPVAVPLRTLPSQLV
jgi:hypothetical protein